MHTYMHAYIHTYVQWLVALPAVLGGKGFNFYSLDPLRVEDLFTTPDQRSPPTQCHIRAYLNHRSRNS